MNDEKSRMQETDTVSNWSTRNKKQWHNAGLMFDQHRRRWSNISPVYGHCLVLVWRSPVNLLNPKTQQSEWNYYSLSADMFFYSSICEPVWCFPDPLYSPTLYLLNAVVMKKTNYMGGRAGIQRVRPFRLSGHLTRLHHPVVSCPRLTRDALLEMLSLYLICVSTITYSHTEMLNYSRNN